ncbi:protein-L-isoaspartate O-methyltransferase family protein [Novosphingobium album (ex Hu et al. 2023)]|uniref:Protein-L-isoaspartate O-methyltransferase n=1 Tax=Novosphingobium album (ex Hu et al. 2023) TaxID=2930093 RepID=A0ABT0B4H3_9SPHN|nr:protein-L-isoaspartate O-methyltransferase [Novosphingobium album (ex Hu et al. 2023)]MCJ2179893.1 protein-L-isoaspartate O-methyltransferase [Novosphingobium album (ex Hu et al. 2023)]
MTLTEERSADMSAARHAMIVSQLRTSGVNEPWVLAAMTGVAREDFVPEAMRDAAYIDRAIPLANGRFLAAPLVHGKMLAEAALEKADKVLLVGDGQGYLAALLRPLAGSLDSVDPAAATGMTGEGGYSLVIIDGAVEELPEAIGAQMAEGGRIVTGLMVRGVSRLATGCKTAGAVSLLPLAELGIPALPEFTAPKRWSF